MLNLISKFFTSKKKVEDTSSKNLDLSKAGFVLESKYIRNNQIVTVPKSMLSVERRKISSSDELGQSSNFSNARAGSENSFYENFKIRFVRNLDKINISQKFRLYLVIAVFAVFSTLLIVSLNAGKSLNLTKGTVAGVTEKAKPKSGKKETSDAYRSWIIDKLGNYNEPDSDFDNDQLTNEEEFIIGSDPKNPNTCNPKKTDAENLVEFINPVTCKSIDITDTTAMEKFKKVIDFNSVRSKVIQTDAKSTTLEPQAETTGSVLKLFGVSSLENLNKQEFDSTKFKSELDLIKTKQESIDKINRVNQYMKESRSLEPFDRNYPIPVNGAVYIEVSLKYNVPLKYTLAVAQRESRFGTDAYDKDGNLTRPGKYKNIFSMGLDDEGNNVGFDTWEKGVESFGRWYKRFNDRGFSDCSKWRIYNPNGDYCKAIEETATQIDNYLKK